MPERPPPIATASALTVAATIELFVAAIVIAPASGAVPVAVIVPPLIVAFVLPPILLTAVAPPPLKARLLPRLRATVTADAVEVASIEELCVARTVMFPPVALTDGDAGDRTRRGRWRLRSARC